MRKLHKLSLSHKITFFLLLLIGKSVCHVFLFIVTGFVLLNQDNVTSPSLNLENLISLVAYYVDIINWS